VSGRGDPRRRLQLRFGQLSRAVLRRHTDVDQHTQQLRRLRPEVRQWPLHQSRRDQQSAVVVLVYRQLRVLVGVLRRRLAPRVLTEQLRFDGSPHRMPGGRKLHRIPDTALLVSLLTTRFVAPRPRHTAAHRDTIVRAVAERRRLAAACAADRRGTSVAQRSAMKFRLLLRAAGLLAMLVSVATRPSPANSPRPPATAMPQTGAPPQVRAGTSAAASHRAAERDPSTSQPRPGNPRTAP